MNDTELVTAQRGRNLVEAIVAALAPPPPPPEPAPIRLTHRQVRANLEAIKAKMCRAWHPHYGYPASQGGDTTEVDKGKVMTIETYLSHYGTCGTYNYNYLCEMLDQETAKLLNDLPMKLCNFEHDLPKLSPLLLLCPSNPTYRALLSRAVRKIPPPELITYEQLKDWVENNYDSENRPATGRVSPPIGQGIPLPQGGPARAYFDVDMELSDTEYGRCRYSLNRSGSARRSYSMADLSNMIEEDDCASLEELTRNVIEDAQEDAWDDAELEGDDYCYDDHEPGDSENSSLEMTLSTRQLQAQLNNFLLQNATREQLEQLDLNTPF